MNRILRDREERYNKTLELLEKYKLPVVCAKINYPGQDKNTPDALRAFEALQKNIADVFDSYILESVTTEGYDGKAELLVLELGQETAKRISMELEEKHSLGRIFDIDVYIPGGSSLSRTEMGKGARECIVCGEDARACIRGGRHSLTEVVDCVNRLIKECE